MEWQNLLGYYVDVFSNERWRLWTGNDHFWDGWQAVQAFLCSIVMGMDSKSRDHC
jgi:hypothetical protein